MEGKGGGADVLGVHLEKLARTKKLEKFLGALERGSWWFRIEMVRMDDVRLIGGGVDGVR